LVVLTAAFSSGDAWRIALAVLLFAIGLTFAWVLVRLAETVARLSSLVKGVERELVPVISKVGGSVDRVNGQLDKVDQMTDSAVDAVDSVDTAIRAVSLAITRPVEKLSGFAAGVSFAFAEFKAHHNWRSAVDAGREAARRREHELAEELRDAGRGSA
jgi:hypothetical protein